MTSADEIRLLRGSVERLLGDVTADGAVRHDSPTGGSARAALWSKLVDLGVVGISLPESMGGGGGSVQAAAEAVSALARFAVPSLVGETTLLGDWAVAQFGLAPCKGQPVTVAAAPFAPPMPARIVKEDLVVSGAAVAVPWSEDAAFVLTSVDVNGAAAVALVPRAAGHVTAGRDLGGQRRDAVVFNQVTVRSGCWRMAENAVDVLLARAAAVRVVEMAAAAAEVLQLTVGYAKEREQFGVPIASFQVVQHHLASLAGNVAALQAAAHLAVRALSESDLRSAAAAKVVASESAGAAWRVAHQVHGAIGLTREHSLHWWTHRLMAWRDEFGSERYWARWLGENVLGSHADAWAELTPA